MIEVKISEITENIVDSAPMGTQINQSRRYPQLCFSESGEAVPDNVYTLKQGERKEMCNVIKGRVIGADWVDRNQVIFLVR